MFGSYFGGMRGIDLDGLVRGGVVGWACGHAQKVLVCHSNQRLIFRKSLSKIVILEGVGN